jgi:hypothetical protein
MNTNEDRTKPFDEDHGCYPPKEQNEWRPLEPGEVIQEGDHGYNGHTMGFEPIHPWAVGLKLAQGGSVLTRRPRPVPTPEPPRSSDWYWMMGWCKMRGISPADANNWRRAEAAWQEEFAPAAPPECSAIAHSWDRDGERCTVCGAKDWMPGGCTAPAAPEPNIVEGNTVKNMGQRGIQVFSTPRTDAQTVTIRYDYDRNAYFVNKPNYDGGEVITADAARTLEHELAAALARVRELEGDLRDTWDKAFESLRPAPQYLDRPDKPGWWWKWEPLGTPPRWVPVHVHPGWLCNPGIWLPATPPPPPSKEGEG